MIDTEKYKNEIKILADDFDKADKIVQEVKIIIGEESIPAISQLRYSGFHLTKWLETKNEECLLEARAHSKRAIFEAARFGIIFCFEEIKKFREIYGGEILPNVIADYSTKMRNSDKAYESILIEGDKDTRANACINSFYELKEIYRELVICQPELNELRQKQENKKFFQRIIFGLTIAGVVGTFAGIAASIWGKF